MSTRWGGPLAAAVLAATGAAGCTRQGTSPLHPAGRFFVEKGCSRCHSVRSLGVVGGAGGAAGAPDLSAAVQDVPNRYGVSVEEFMQQPRSGMMSLVLDQSLRLSSAERSEAARRLHVAFEEKRTREAGGAR